MFERAERAAKAGAKTSSTLKDSGVIITRFTARNGSRIFIETKCIKKKGKLITKYMVSCQGIPKGDISNRDEALQYLKEIGGYNQKLVGKKPIKSKPKEKMTIEKLMSLKKNKAGVEPTAFVKKEEGNQVEKDHTANNPKNTYGKRKAEKTTRPRRA